jgi:D-sedoheptulose 7-phosphate isomerase
MPPENTLFAATIFEMQELIQSCFAESIRVKNLILSDADFLERIEKVAREAVEVYRRDGKILFAGNGGSAADAQHLAAELSGRFYVNRPPLFAEALHVNSSYVTAVANDFGYDFVFARMLEAAGRKGDMFFAFSTSGNSPNILAAIEKAKEKGMIVVGFTGETGGKMSNLCDFLFNVPSRDTPRIQEAHILIGHIICLAVEKNLFSE